MVGHGVFDKGTPLGRTWRTIEFDSIVPRTHRNRRSSHAKVPAEVREKCLAKEQAAAQRAQADRERA